MAPIDRVCKHIFLCGRVEAKEHDNLALAGEERHVGLQRKLGPFSCDSGFWFSMSAVHKPKLPTSSVSR